MGQSESNYQVPSDGGWKGSWNEVPTATTKPSSSASHRQKIGSHHHHAAALEALLTHYPWIVYLGVTFWRKLLLRVWFKQEKYLENRLPSLTGSEPLEDTESNIQERHLLRRLGISGRLDVFSSRKLHRRFLTERIPLTPSTWASINEREDEMQAKSLEDARFSEFLIGLIKADQVDVMRCMITDFQLNPIQLFAQDDLDPLQRIKAADSSSSSLILRHAPTHSSLPLYLLRQCHPAQYSGEERLDLVFLR